MFSSTRPGTALHKLGQKAGFFAALSILAVAVMAGPMGLLQSRQERAAAIVTTPEVTSPAAAVASTTLAITVPGEERARPKATRKTTRKATATVTVPSKPRAVRVSTAPKVSAPHRIVIVTPASAPAAAPVPAPPPAAPAPAPHTYHAISDPSASVAPSAQMQSDCGSSRLAACNSDSLAAINKARAAEGLGALPLPSNFYALSITSQVLTVINAERTSRGLPAFSYNPAYQSPAQNGANTSSDPTGPSGSEWSAIFASGYPTALAADFAWMYDDGPNSPNVDCTAASSSGCWGHRNAILSPWAGSAAVGWATVNGTTNLAALFVAA